MQINGEKISMIISHFCDSDIEFAQVMNERPNTISNWKNRGFGFSVAKKIVSKFPDVNCP